MEDNENYPEQDYSVEEEEEENIIEEENLADEENLQNQEDINEDKELEMETNLSNLENKINPPHKFIYSDNIDLDFNSSFYTDRQLDIQQLRTILNKESHHGLTGIKNFGNTCYINTIVQCLSHSVDLTYFLISQLYQKEINNTQGNGNIKRGIKPGHFSNILSKVLASLWINDDKSIAPTDLRFLISNHLPQFNNTNQQDAHEMMMSILDLIHEDLNKAQIQPGNSKYNEECPPKMNHESDVSAAKRFWNYYKERNNSIIVDLFTGQLKNTVECIFCGNSSIKFEPFVTLPLAIPKMKKVDVIIVPSINIKSNIKLTLYVSESAMFIDLPIYLKKYLNSKMKVERFRCLLINGKTQTAKFTKNSENIYNSSKKGFIFIYEIDDRIAEDEDYYPFITLIRDRSEEDEIKNEIINENKDDLVNENGTENKKSNKFIKYNNYVNSSFPRLFAMNQLSSVKDLRQNLYGFIRKYYQPPQLISESIFDNKFIKFCSNYNEYNHLDEDEYEQIIKEEYNFFFNNNNENIDSNIINLKKEYLLNFPFIVSLFSTKEETKSKNKVFFSNSSEEYNKTINDSSQIEKLIDIIKTGYKIIIELKKQNSNYVILKASLNSTICINNKNREIDFNKTPTIEDCLDHFKLTERLDKGNEWYCSNCRKNQNAYKRIELFYIPKNFIIILNRFETKMMGKFKIQILKNNTFVKYPVTGLNLTNFIEGAKEPKPFYDLYSVSQHSGSVEGGHYATACRNMGKWYEFDDISLFPSDENLIVSPEGYILFFKRQDKTT